MSHSSNVNATPSHKGLIIDRQWLGHQVTEIWFKMTVLIESEVKAIVLQKDFVR